MKQDMPGHQRDALMVRLRQEGKLLREIAEELGMRVTAVSRRLRKLGVTVPNKTARKERSKLAMALWEEGKDEEAIAKDMGVKHVSTVVGLLTLANPHYKVYRNKVEALRLYEEEEWSAHDIARKLGVSKKTVYAYLRSMNYTPSGEKRERREWRKLEDEE